MTPANVQQYLDRIRVEGPCPPTVETLRRIHRTHMLAVPFENLDIHLGVPLMLSIPALFDKIVMRQRGGFCYELNGLFAGLLEALGFHVLRLSGRVFENGHPGPEFGVHLDGHSTGRLWRPAPGASASPNTLSPPDQSC